MGADQRGDWIDEVELPDVKVKWHWSYFDGRGEGLNSPGDHNFTIILPEDVALDLREKGWTGIKENDGYEEGDPSEWTLKIKCSWAKIPPAVYLLKNGRKFRCTSEKDLAQIRRDMTDQIDVIITPSRWVQPGRTGVTAYVKEMYAQIRESRFAAQYADYEEV